jgi:hypothetical protein
VIKEGKLNLSSDAEILHRSSAPHSPSQRSG